MLARAGMHMPRGLDELAIDVEGRRRTYRLAPAYVINATGTTFRASIGSGFKAPTLNQLFDKVLAIPGVAELLKPTIDALKAKLAVLAT